MFYPSKQGDSQIKLYKNALIKIQGFHTAFGEDAQIYSKEEIVKEFQMFDKNVKDCVDKRIALLRELRELYNNNRELYQKIKNLPMKSRVMRDTGNHSGKSIVFVSSNVKTEFYLATADGIDAIDFLKAVEYLKAEPEEKPVPFTSDEQHYRHVNGALDKYIAEFVQSANPDSINRVDLDNVSLESIRFLREIKRKINCDEMMSQCDVLIEYIEEGIYAQLPRELRDLSRTYKKSQDEYAVQTKINALYNKYRTMKSENDQVEQGISNPQIVISESFR